MLSLDRGWRCDYRAVLINDPNGNLDAISFQRSGIEPTRHSLLFLCETRRFIQFKEEGVKQITGTWWLRACSHSMHMHTRMVFIPKLKFF